MNSTQLNIFEQPIPKPAPLQSESGSKSPTAVVLDERFSPGVRIQISQAGPPLEYLNGRTGVILDLLPGCVSVQVDNIAVPITFRVEALESYSPKTYINEEESVLIEVGSVVQCDNAFLGMVGIVRQVGFHGGVAIAWVDYGHGRPLYPALIESLSLA